jgi:hypothetical protein
LISVLKQQRFLFALNLLGNIPLLGIHHTETEIGTNIGIGTVTVKKNMKKSTGIQTRLIHGNMARNHEFY